MRLRSRRATAFARALRRDPHHYRGDEEWPFSARLCRDRLVEENAALLAELSDRERPARYAPDFTPIDRTNAFIQWKGTDVCLDFHCECGGGGHFDGDFAYTLQCKNCGRVWAMPHTVALVETTDPDDVGRARVPGEDEDE